MVKLDVNNNINLEYLDLSNNKLVKLDVNNLIKIKYLDLSNNKLTELNKNSFNELNNLNYFNIDLKQKFNFKSKNKNLNKFRFIEFIKKDIIEECIVCYNKDYLINIVCKHQLCQSCYDIINNTTCPYCHISLV